MPMTALSRSILYAVTVLIWGSTWYAIEMQLGVVNQVVSIAHRFALAGLVVLLGLVLSGRFRPIARRHQKFLFLQGLLLFSGNYIFIYSGTASLPSGLVSVVFSMMVITNMLAGENISCATVKLACRIQWAGRYGRYWGDICSGDSGFYP